MSTFNHEIFGSISPATTNETTLFQVPASHEYVIDEYGIVIQGLNVDEFTIRIARVDGGATTANEDWVVYDMNVGREARIHGILAGAAFAATDSVVIKLGTAGTGTISVSGLDIDNS